MSSRTPLVETSLFTISELRIVSRVAQALVPPRATNHMGMEVLEPLILGLPCAHARKSALQARRNWLSWFLPS